MTDRSEPADEVLTPDVVGLVVDDARAVALAAGVVLAQPDPDGPPLAALTWRQPVTVTGQDPPPGTPVRRYASVVVTWDSAAGAVREPRRPAPRTLPGAGDALRP